MNTSHNDETFVGILQTYVESLERKPRGKNIVGQQVAKLKKDTIAIIALDGTDDTHLLISTNEVDAPGIVKLDLRGMKVTMHELAIEGHPNRTYFDICCATGDKPSFRRPFLRFAEDVLFEISNSAKEPADAIKSTGMRWRRFWSLDPAGISDEWLHGLFGELLFMNAIIEKCGTGMIERWTGPNGRDHDFHISNELGIEIKTTTQVPLQIDCNIHQLDNDIYDRLFLVCYLISSDEKGKSLTDLVLQIEDRIDDDQILDLFYEKLAAVGYRREMELAYEEKHFSSGKPQIFCVDDKFPKITQKSFTQSPDNRISAIRYKLKITGIPELEFEELLKFIA